MPHIIVNIQEIWTIRWTCRASLNALHQAMIDTGVADVAAIRTRSNT